MIERHADIENSVLAIIDRQLGLHGMALHFTADSRLHGHLPQLDSMAVVAIVAAIEEDLNIEFPEAELDGVVFETVGSLVHTITRLVASKN